MEQRAEAKIAPTDQVFQRFKNPCRPRGQIRSVQTKHCRAHLKKSHNHRSHLLSLCQNSMIHHKNPKLAAHLPAMRLSYRIKIGSPNLMFDRFTDAVSESSSSFFFKLCPASPAPITLDCIISFHLPLLRCHIFCSLCDEHGVMIPLSFYVRVFPCAIFGCLSRAHAHTHLAIGLSAVSLLVHNSPSCAIGHDGVLSERLINCISCGRFGLTHIRILSVRFSNMRLYHTHQVGMFSK